MASAWWPHCGAGVTLFLQLAYWKIHHGLTHLSLAGSAKGLLEAGRTHWGLEYSVHWVLDVAVDEGRSRVRKDNALKTYRSFVSWR